MTLQDAVDSLYQVAVVEGKSDFVQEARRLGPVLRGGASQTRTRWRGHFGGTVPNRVDDLMGEVTNVQMYSPEIVAGYIMLFNVAEDSYSPLHLSTWAGLLKTRRGAVWAGGVEGGGRRIE